MGYTITNKKTGETVDVDTSTGDKKAFYDTLYHRQIQEKRKETIKKQGGKKVRKQ